MSYQNNLVQQNYYIFKRIITFLNKIINFSTSKGELLAKNTLFDFLNQKE